MRSCGSDASPRTKQQPETALAHLHEALRLTESRHQVIVHPLALKTLADTHEPLGHTAAADHFKSINDRYSHRIGDEVLRRIGSLLLSHCRRDDMAARVGGEEFVLLVSNLARDQMLLVVERLRRAVQDTDWTDLHPDLRVTVSIGVAYHDEAGEQAVAAIDALMSLADRRMYAAKASGRNRIGTVDSQGGEDPAAG